MGLAWSLRGSKSAAFTHGGEAPTLKIGKVGVPPTCTGHIPPNHAYSEQSNIHIKVALWGFSPLGRFEIGFFSLERCGLRPPQGKGGAFPLWGGREIQNPVSDRHPVGHLGPQLAGIRYLGSQKGVKKVCLGLEGSSTARHLGPPPRIDLKFGSMDACRSRTARSRRVLCDRGGRYARLFCHGAREMCAPNGTGPC